MTFVDQHTVRLIGKQIKHRKDRKGFPLVSQVDQRRQEKTETCGKRSFCKAEIDAAAASTNVDKLQREFKSVKVDVEKLISDKQTLAAESRRAKTSQGKAQRWNNKQELRAKQRSFLDLENQLRVSRSSRHRSNMMVKAAKNAGDPSTSDEKGNGNISSS
ncbi:hypothetical protein BGZ65_005757, partial [Modicella reniformis]